MNNRSMRENKFGEGDVVYALQHPEIKLIVRRFLDRVYYCQLVEDRTKPDLVYFERELTEAPEQKITEAQEFGR